MCSVRQHSPTALKYHFRLSCCNSTSVAGVGSGRFEYPPAGVCLVDISAYVSVLNRSGVLLTEGQAEPKLTKSRRLRVPLPKRSTLLVHVHSYITWVAWRKNELEGGSACMYRWGSQWWCLMNKQVYLSSMIICVLLFFVKDRVARVSIGSLQSNLGNG